MHKHFYATVISNKDDVLVIRWHNTEFGTIQSTETKETALEAWRYFSCKELEDTIGISTAW